jgi:hypothetical protein
MEKESWQYINSSVGIQLNKISNLFSNQNIEVEGDQNKGRIVFKSTKISDEVWGPEAKIEVSWEKTDPLQYHHGLKVKETIRMFSSIEVVATKKETHWHLSHEMTYWFGNRQQILRRRFFPSNIIHAVFFCELSHRVFEIHFVTLTASYSKYEKHILDTFFSLQCHG